MKDLEKENVRLRRAISDLTLDKLILHGETSKPRAPQALYRPHQNNNAGVWTGGSAACLGDID